MAKYINSNLTPSEIARLHLPLEEFPFLEDWARSHEAVNRYVEEIEPALNEAAAQYPGEDFLQPLIDRVAVLAKRLRSDNKAEAEEIARLLEGVQCDDVRGATEYGLEQLRNAVRMLKGAR